MGNRTKTPSVMTSMATTRTRGTDRAGRDRRAGDARFQQRATTNHAALVVVVVMMRVGA